MSLFEADNLVQESTNTSILNGTALNDGLTFNSDGTKFFVGQTVNPNIASYSLDTAYDFTANPTQVNTANLNHRATGIDFNDDGTKMYISADNDTNSIHQYSLSTAYDISTRTKDTEYLPTDLVINPHSISFNSDGTVVFIADNKHDEIRAHSVSAAYDLGTAGGSPIQTFDLDFDGTINKPQDIHWGPDGLAFYVINENPSVIRQHNLSNAYDLTSFENAIDKNISGPGIARGGAWNKNDPNQDNGFVFLSVHGGFNTDGTLAVWKTRIPDAEFTISPTYPFSGDSITFDATNSVDIDGSISSYDWTAVDKFGNTLWNDSGQTITHSFSDSGTYSVTLTVTDNDGRTDSTTTDVRINEARFFYYPTTPNIGETAKFDASDTADDPNAVQSYDWTATDSNSNTVWTDTGEVITQSFSASDTFTVELSVTDSNGDVHTTSQVVGVSSNTATVSPQNYDFIKDLNVQSVSGSPEVDIGQPIYLSSGDTSITGTGQVVLDWSVISGASDIAVFDEDGVRLDYEIEELDTSNNIGIIWAYNNWIRDGSFQARIAYGSGPADYQNVEGTWRNTTWDFVHHMEEDSLPLEDSTSNNNDISNSNQNFFATETGQINGAVSTTESGNKGFYTVPDDPTVSMTSNDEVVVFQTWVRHDTFDSSIAGTEHFYMDKEDEVSISSNENGNLRIASFGSNSGYISAGLTANTWYLLTFVFDETREEYEIFVDNGSGTKASTNGDTSQDGTNDFILGNRTFSSGKLFYGDFDTTRYSVGSYRPDQTVISAFYDASAKAGQIFFSQQSGVPTNIPPSASFGYSPTTILPTEDVTFDGTLSSDSDGTIQSYSWEAVRVSDNTTVWTDSGSTITQSFPDDVDYDITLTVTDDDGAISSTTLTITVQSLVTTNSATNIGTQSATLEGNIDNFKGSNADVQFEWREQGVTTWNTTSVIQKTSTGSFSESISGLSASTTYEFRALGTDAQGNSETDDTLSFTAQSDSPPTADFDFSPTNPITNQDVDFDGTLSSDDISIQSYDWEAVNTSTSNTVWTDTSSTITQQFSEDVDYDVTLTITDSSGQQNSVTKTVSVSNQPPVADFNFTPSTPKPNETVNFDGLLSNDPDGTIQSYSWDFGDGSPTESGQTVSHSYSSAGTYSVTLTVTDNDGANDSVTKDVTVNELPTADFTFSPNNQLVGQSVDFTDQSSDPDGSIQAWSWDFGDGSSSTQQNPSYAYSSSGDYTVTLTVTDDAGSSDSIQQTVSINRKPTASFNFTPSSPDKNQDVTFDGNTSTDDSTITDYSWQAVDNNTSNTVWTDGGATVTQQFPDESDYDVTLTVTDDDGAQDSITKTVSTSMVVLPSLQCEKKVIGTRDKIFDDLTISQGDQARMIKELADALFSVCSRLDNLSPNDF